MEEIAYCFTHFQFTLNEMLGKLKEKGIEASPDRVQREVKKSDKFKVNIASSGKVSRCHVDDFMMIAPL